jgi:PKD repeat protein/subtilisin-like proprotein convertase family protein
LTSNGGYNRISDNGCTLNAVTTIGLPQTGLPTTLGTAAGNARLLSVELIVSHTWNEDLEVRLTSPSGVTRDLVVSRFGNGDNLGNPGSCTPLVLLDGAAALTNGNASNVTGNRAPEQTLAGFTGNPNGTWTLSICDNANNDLGYFRYVKLNFCTVPLITATSSSSPVCAGNTLDLGATATGTAPLTYTWTGTGTYSPNNTTDNVTVTGAATGNYNIAVSNTCGSTNTNVAVIVNPAPSATISYTGSPYCSTGGTASVTRTGTAGGSYSAGAGLSLNTSTGAVDLAASTPGTYTVTYTIAAAGGCALFQTTASITVTAAPSATISYTGSPYCSTGGTASVTQAGTAGGSYSSTAGLSINAGTGEVNLGASTAGTYTVTYTIVAAGGCALFQTTASITVTAAPSATINYGAQPRCQIDGTISVNLTGTGGGTYSAGAGLSLNTSTGAVDLAASTPGTYTVTYTIAAAGGCALFTTDTSIEVAAPDTWYADTDADGFGDPAVTTQSCVPVPGYVLDSTDNCPSVFGLIGDACDDGNADTVGDLLLGDCSCAGTNTPWYSQSGGDHTAAIWSHSVSGPGTAVTFSSTSIVVVQSGHAVNVVSAASMGDLTVQSGASVLLGANDLSVFGSSIVLNGDVESTTGELRFEPAAAATITGTGSIDVNDMSVDAAVSLSNAVTTDIRGTLLLENGAFSVSGNTRLVSNASGTARLGPVGAGASYTGDLIVERFIPGGATNWRLLGSPVAGRTVFNWKDDFFMAGFTGSHYPNFYSGGVLWPSVRKYDETVSSADLNAGLVGVAGTAESLAAGRGYAAWSGDAAGGTAAFTVDVKGSPNVAATPIALPITYTNSGNPTADGWNLVSNPLPSPIDFTLISRGADVANQYWIFDPATGNNLVWSSGVGSGAANGIIQSSQGIWMKATGAATTTTVDESAKVLAPTGGVFGGSEDDEMPVLRLAITSSMNSFADEAVVVFDQGTPAFDAIDAQQFVFAHPQAPQVATRSSDGVNLSIDFYGGYGSAISIPVLVNAAVTGTYTITAEMSGIRSLSCLSIEDLATGTITTLADGASYSFVMDANDDASEPRFLIHGSAPLPLVVENSTCAAAGNGSAMVNVGESPVNVTWMNANGGVLLQQDNVSGEAIYEGIAPGNYQVSIATGNACGTLVAEFSVEEPFAIEVSTEAIAAASCPNTPDGSVDVQVLGGVGPYSYEWSNGASTEDLVAGEGTYSLTVTDANGCTLQVNDLMIGAGEGPVAGIAAESSVMMGVPVVFTSTAALAESWAWDFGDGTTSNDENPEHSYSIPGLYTVTLVVSYGDCSDISTFEIAVELSTGITEVPTNTVRAWVANGGFVIEHNYDRGYLTVEVLDASGRLVSTNTYAAAPGQVLLPGTGLAPGIWTLRLTNDQEQRTIRVPLMR